MSRYVILCETNSEEIEQWYYFIKYNGNEKFLKYLKDQFDKVELELMDDLSIFDLDLTNTVSEETAKEMVLIDINPTSYHRKFDGKLKCIDFKLKKKDSNEDMLDKIHNILSYGRIDNFIDKEDKNGRVDSDDDEDSDEENDLLVPLPDDNNLLLPDELKSKKNSDK